MKGQTLSAVVLLALLTGCSSTYTYHVEPTPIARGETHYRVANLDVSLQNGRDDHPVKDPFVDEEELTEQFRKTITQKLKAEQILAEQGDTNVADLEIVINYLRRYVWWNASALIRPVVGHEVKVKSGDQLLASTSRSDYTTSYGMLGNAVRSFEIVFMNYGPENEREDVEVISKALVRDLSELGKDPAEVDNTLSGS